MSKAMEALERLRMAATEGYVQHTAEGARQAANTVLAALAAAEWREHRYDEDGECEVCGQEQACRPAIARTVRREPVAWEIAMTTPEGTELGKGWSWHPLKGDDDWDALRRNGWRVTLRPLGYLDGEGV